jgi:hypothetical protein
MSENIAVVAQGFDARAALRVAHQERGAARAERDRLAEALDRSRAELQQILDAQRDRDAAREADVARFVEARTAALLAGKLGNAEGKVRYAEGKVRDAAAVLLVEHGERLAGELEVAEAEARAQRASLASLAGVWTPGARRGPLQIGPKCHWLLTDGNANIPEAVTGTRRQRAKQLGHALPEERLAPDWQRLFNSLLEDPETELP